MGFDIDSISPWWQRIPLPDRESVVDRMLVGDYSLNLEYEAQLGQPADLDGQLSVSAGGHQFYLACQFVGHGALNRTAGPPFPLFERTLRALQQGGYGIAVILPAEVGAFEAEILALEMKLLSASVPCLSTLPPSEWPGYRMISLDLWVVVDGEDGPPPKGCWSICVDDSSIIFCDRLILKADDLESSAAVRMKSARWAEEASAYIDDLTGAEFPMPWVAEQTARMNALFGRRDASSWWSSQAGNIVVSALQPYWEGTAYHVLRPAMEHFIDLLNALKSVTSHALARGHALEFSW